MGTDLDGWVDEVRVWNTTRTQAQVSGNYSLTLNGTTAGLLHYVRFDDGQAVSNSVAFGPNHQPNGAEDFTHPFDWNQQWRHAIRLNGNVAFARPGALTDPPSLTVVIQPAGAINAGAQWAVDGGDWRESGITYYGLNAGTHPVSFRPVIRWITPVTTNISLPSTGNTSITVTYTAAGILQVALHPAEACDNGARWRVDGGPWQDTGATLENLAVGSHTLAYLDVSGWTSPTSEVITLVSGVQTNIHRFYNMEAPSWWFALGIVNSNVTAEDGSGANQGQLKWMASRAYIVMTNVLNYANGGAAVSNMIFNVFTPSNNFQAVNLGQVKFVAAPFWDWLIAEGEESAYPWSGLNENDFALATIGQIKRAFLFLPDASPTPGPQPGPVSNLTFVAAGAYQMGDTYNEIGTNALPVHSLFVSAFYMDTTEVHYSLWTNVYQWATAHGYNFSKPGAASATNHPVHSMSWYDAVKWCNARSEMNGLTPVYYINAQTATVYRTGQIDITNACVRWMANGYRLPTEAEWEKAARGNVVGNRYPWGNTISGSQANYSGSADPYEPNTTPVGYYNGSQIPAGSDMRNAYGLYDISGNVREWCWDYYDPSWYGRAEATVSDCQGPNAGQLRITRGGSRITDATTMPNELQCATRGASGAWSDATYTGFRCVRRP
jgi:formylglycine-generating enzyme required for sulfatase activity